MQRQLTRPALHRMWRLILKTGEKDGCAARCVALSPLSQWRVTQATIVLHTNRTPTVRGSVLCCICAVSVPSARSPPTHPMGN